MSEEIDRNAMNKIEDFRKVVDDLEDKVSIILKASQQLLTNDIVSVKSYLTKASKESSNVAYINGVSIGSNEESSLVHSQIFEGHYSFPVPQVENSFVDQKGYSDSQSDHKWTDNNLILNGPDAWNADYKEDAFEMLEKFDDWKEANERDDKMIDSKTIGEKYYDDISRGQIVREVTDPIPNLDIKTEITNLPADLNIVCFQCSKIFPSQSKLDSHIKLKHSAKKELAETKVYTCAFCEYQSVNKADLKEHVKTHEDPESYLCQHCAIQCKTKDALSHHIKVNHQEEHKFYCHRCPYKCNKKSRIIKHVNYVHEKNTEFKCQLCPFMGFDNNSVKKHIMGVHEKIKNEICPYCSRAFAYKNNLQTHVRTIHEKKKRFSCEFCPYKTDRKGYLKSHQRENH